MCIIWGFLGGLCAAPACGHSWVSMFAMNGQRTMPVPGVQHVVSRYLPFCNNAPIHDIAHKRNGIQRGSLGLMDGRCYCNTIR